MSEQRALGWLAVAAVAAIAWLAWSFTISLLLGALMAFTLEPLYQRLVQRTGRPLFAALTMVILSGLAVLAAAAAFVTLFVMRFVELANVIVEELQPGGSLTTGLHSVTRWLDGRGISTADLTERLQSGAGEIASKSAAIAGSIAAGTFQAILGLFFALLTMYVVLRYWPRMVTAVVAVSPLRPNHTRTVLAEFEHAGKGTLAGTVITGLAQGILAGVGFWMSGLPQPAFFGAATAVASLMPGIGTLLVWVPAGLYLLATGHPGGGIGLLIWGAVMVVGLSDYVIRPRLVGDEATPAILVFVALFGGLEMLGLSGLIMGPIIMSLATATLRLYARERRRRNSNPAVPPGSNS
jgi:predicted PurR-regulated permease PerM